MTVTLPAPHTDREQVVSEETLRAVSRTFALCIRVLPPRLRTSVHLAYLLCRIADTIEDSPDLDEESRARMLRQFGEAVSGSYSGPLEVEARFAGARGPDEMLAGRAGTAIALLRELPGRHRSIITQWVKAMCDGMATFPVSAETRAAGSFRVVANWEGLRRYCFIVAGTVGRMLDELFHPGSAGEPELAVSLARGLQITNIIKDVPNDLGRGWCFVPGELLDRHGLEPGELSRPGRKDDVVATLDGLRAVALEDLARGFVYCQRLPRWDIRVRMFCLIPLFLALETLGMTDIAPYLADRSGRLKISRGRVRLNLAVALLSALFPGLGEIWNRHLQVRSARVRSLSPAGVY